MGRGGVVLGSLAGTALLCALIGAGCGDSKSKSSVKQVTFYEHVAPLVWKNCATCHRKGEAGPFELLTYEQVKKHASQMAKVTASRSNRLQSVHVRSPSSAHFGPSSYEALVESSRGIGSRAAPGVSWNKVPPAVSAAASLGTVKRAMPLTVCSTCARYVAPSRARGLRLHVRPRS